MRGPVAPQLDAEEFLRWEARQDAKFELHHGFVLSFAGGSVDHDRLTFNLRTGLYALYPAPCRSFGTDLAPKATIVETPRVVGEVLPPSTRSYDIVEKRSTYRAMPSMEQHVIEVDSRNADGTWSTICYDEGAAYLGDREMPLDDIYARSWLASAPPSA